MSDIKSTNVQVAVRCRPFNSEERKNGAASCISCNPESKTVQVSYGPPGKKIAKNFAYDKVFGMYSTQEEVFNSTVKPIVDEALAGFNCTIFAYGQTGTGKTHTMEGDINSEENAGIVPRSVKWILEQLENGEAEYTIRVSFLELYNEELQDLLNNSKDKKLKLCEDGVKGVVCQNLEEITVLGASDIFEIMQRGIQNRQTAATLCNKNSSRSHSIFTLKIMIKECSVDGEEVVRHGQLNLVDLAGSECVGRSGAKNDRAREAGNINQSLLTLGRVITALVDHHSHIPYRDSKLTRLLQESLGGKTKTCIIATLSPSQGAVEETMSTLDYAYRARSIKNQPIVNQRMTKKVVLKDMCSEIENLKYQLSITREKNGVYLNPAEYDSLLAKVSAQESQLMECEGALKARTEEFKAIKGEKEELTKELEAIRLQLAQTTDKLELLTQQHEEVKIELAETKVDLQASNRVITEVAGTEAKLQEQGCGLQDKLLTAQEKLSSLFGKIDEFSANEQRNSKTTSHFCQTLSSHHQQLKHSMETLCQQNEQNNEYLVDGVKGMIHCSQELSISLKASIFQAVKTIQGVSEDGKDCIESASQQLCTDITSTESSALQTLGKLQRDIDDWMNTFQAIYGQMTVKLNSQETLIAEHKESLGRFAESVAVVNSEFIQETKHRSGKLQSELDSFRNQLLTVISAHHQQHAEQAQSTQAAMESQAKEMEAKISEMVQGMISTSLLSMQSACKSSDSLLGSVIALATNGHSVATKLASEQQTAIVEAADKSDISMQQQLSTSVRALDSLQSTRADLAKSVHQCGIERSQCSEISHRVLSTVNTDLSRSLQSLSGQVIQTSSHISEALSSIDTSSQELQSTVGRSIADFNEYLDSNSQELTNTLASHLQHINETISSTMMNAVDEAVEITTGHKDTMETATVQHSGATPNKREMSQFHKEMPLAKSRDHESIRREVLVQYYPERYATVQPPVAVEVSATKETISTARISTDSVSSSTSSVSMSSTGSRKRKNVEFDTGSNASSGNSYTENSNPNPTPAKAKKQQRTTNRSKSVEAGKGNITTSRGGRATVCMSPTGTTDL